MAPGSPGERESAIPTTRIDHRQAAARAPQAPRHVAELVVEHPRRDAQGVAELVEVVLPRGQPADQALSRSFDLGLRRFGAVASPSPGSGSRLGDVEAPGIGPPGLWGPVSRVVATGRICP